MRAQIRRIKPLIGPHCCRLSLRCVAAIPATYTSSRLTYLWLVCKCASIASIRWIRGSRNVHEMIILQISLSCIRRGMPLSPPPPLSSAVGWLSLPQLSLLSHSRPHTRHHSFIQSFITHFASLFVWPQHSFSPNI